MNLKEYQEFCATTDISNGTVEYYGLGLASEAGEVAGKIKKISRDDNGIITEIRREQIIDEMSDIYWYLARLSSKLDVSMESVIRRNIAKLSSRKEAGTIGGDGDVR